MSDLDAGSVSWVVLDPILGEIDQKLSRLNELLEQLVAIQRQAALSPCGETVQESEG